MALYNSKNIDRDRTIFESVAMAAFFAGMYIIARKYLRRSITR